jgi:hypothetical protein
MSAAHPSSKPFWPIFLGGILLLLVFAVAVKLLVAWAPVSPDDDAARAAERTKAREELEADNRKKLETYAWADKTKASVEIPIKRAMELTLADLNGRQPGPAGPIATPPPATPDAIPAAAASGATP